MADVSPPTAWDWLGPAHVAAPTEALQRIAASCALHAVLSTAGFVVLATHLRLSHEPPANLTSTGLHLTPLPC